jgi:hypothetical protein
MAINQYFDGYIPLSNGFLSATTPNNSGTGGGSSGGGPVCIHEDEIVDIEGLGRMRIFDAAPGGRICGEDVRTGERKYRRILGREIEHCSDWYAVKGHLMTSCEPVWTSGKWVSAHDVPDSRQVFGVPGRKVRIYVEGDNFDDHNFILFGADGDITVHNPIQLS